MLVAAGAEMGTSAKVDVGAEITQRQGCCAGWSTGTTVSCRKSIKDRGRLNSLG
jgi:hypothetical protein